MTLTNPLVSTYKTLLKAFLTTECQRWWNRWGAQHGAAGRETQTWGCTSPLNNLDGLQSAGGHLDLTHMKIAVAWTAVLFFSVAVNPSKSIEIDVALLGVLLKRFQLAVHFLVVWPAASRAVSGFTRGALCLLSGPAFGARNKRVHLVAGGLLIQNVALQKVRKLGDMCMYCSSGQNGAGCRTFDAW